MLRLFLPYGFNAGSLAWLLRPSRPALGFALRTTIAALVALMIAMWMELDDPQWAPMTVWIVAQGSRGESLSKGRWRLVGTAAGAIVSVVLIALFPQQPWLFFPALGLWLGFCCGAATITRNFRAYALVLAGYTAAIIATSAVPDPDDIFMIMMSRVTYIVLGILCEGLISTAFSANEQEATKREIHDALQHTIDDACLSVAATLDQQPDESVSTRVLFGNILALHDKLEYAESQGSSYNLSTASERAALAGVSVLLSRAAGMAVRMEAAQPTDASFDETRLLASALLRSVPERLARESTEEDLLAAIARLKTHCRDHMDRALSIEMAEAENRLSESGRPESDRPEGDSPQGDHPEGERPESDQLAQMNSRVLHSSLTDMLGDLEYVIEEYGRRTHAVPAVYRTLRIRTHVDADAAVYNGLRAFIAVIAAAMVWEVTAWPTGLSFITFVAIVCGLFATRDNPVLASRQFLVGAVWAAAVSFILVFIVLPPQSNYEVLLYALGVPMVAGGLALRYAGTAIHGAAYTLLLPNFVHPANQTRLSEVAWFNATLSVLLASAFAVVIFRAVLPFNVEAERGRTRQSLLRDLRRLGLPGAVPSGQEWVERNIDRFVRIARRAATSPGQATTAHLQGTLAAMTVGLNIIRLRALATHGSLPVAARRVLNLLFRRLTHVDQRPDVTHRTAALATQILRRLETSEPSATVRIELTRAISFLIVVEGETRRHAHFLRAGGKG